MISIVRQTELGQSSQCDYKNIVPRAGLKFSKYSMKQFKAAYEHLG